MFEVWFRISNIWLSVLGPRSLVQGPCLLKPRKRRLGSKDRGPRTESQFSKCGFDKKMQEYASIVNYGKDYFMFYNGNNYGEEGIGIAKLVK